MPYVDDRDYFNSGQLRRRVQRTWQVQPKPYTKSLPYLKTVENNRSKNVGLADSSGIAQLGRYGWVDTAARNSAISNLQGKLQTAQLGNALAEYKTSADMIASRAKQLYQAYRDVKRGRLADAASTLGIRQPARSRARSAAGVWLEYHYGWKPLISDVYGASKIFRHPQQPKLLRFSGRSTKRTSNKGWSFHGSKVEHDERYDPSSGNIVVVPTIQTIIQFNINYSIECSAEAVCHLRDVTALQRLQLDNPAQIVWELLPFSFIADWFFPIGTYLTSLSPAFQRQVVSSSSTTKGTVRSKLSHKVLQDDGWDGPYASTLLKDYPSDLGDSFKLERTGGLAISKSFDRSFLQGDSFTRAGHAVSLLVAIFSTRDGEGLPNTIWNKPLF